MNDFDDLHDLLDPLRSPATPAELASEADIVDAMARNHRHTKGPTMFSARRGRVAAFIAAGVLGFGGVAAAGHGGSIELDHLEEPTSEVSPSSDDSQELPPEPEPEPQPEPQPEPEPEPEVQIEKSEVILVEEEPVDGPVDVDDGSTDFDENLCLEGNHGKTVSAAARGDRELVESELDSEEAVDAFFGYSQSEVAQSSCGKDYMDDELDEDDLDDLDEQEIEGDDHDEDDDHDDDEKKSSRPDKGRPDHAGERSNGKKNRD